MRSAVLYRAGMGTVLAVLRLLSEKLEIQKHPSKNLTKGTVPFVRFLYMM